MRGILTAAGVASLAATTVMSAPGIALTANVLTVTGYTAYGSLKWDMDDIFQGSFCSSSSGNTCSAVRYLSGVPHIGEFDGLLALNAAIKATTAPTTVMAFSQGSLVSSQWLRQNAWNPAAPDPTELSFILAANPDRKYGGVRARLAIEPATPTKTDYPVLDIAVEYDGFADFPDNPFNLLALANAVAGLENILLPGYNDVDLDTDDKLVWQDGNTTYVLVRTENIPLLDPLRRVGLDHLADELNTPLKKIIDSAYDRNYPNMVAPQDQAAALSRFRTTSLTSPTRALAVDEEDAEVTTKIGRHVKLDASKTDSKTVTTADSRPDTTSSDTKRGKAVRNFLRNALSPAKGSGTAKHAKDTGGSQRSRSAANSSDS